MSAIKGGASLVHSVDSSQMAVDLTNENLALNGIDSSVHLAIKSDALDYLKNMKEQYDIIVLDPPAYAKHLSARHKAVQGYRRLNEAAFRKASSGTLVFTFSCSQAVDKPLFASTVFSAALGCRKKYKGTLPAAPAFRSPLQPISSRRRVPQRSGSAGNLRRLYHFHCVYSRPR